MILHCKYCTSAFKAWRARQKFCSHKCHDESRQKVDREELRNLCQRGVTKSQMARIFNVRRNSVCSLIERENLERLWRQHRYA